MNVDYLFRYPEKFSWTLDTTSKQQNRAFDKLWKLRIFERATSFLGEKWGCGKNLSVKSDIVIYDFRWSAEPGMRDA
jgi:hypothetical protein